ncbi:S8 family peptidase [Alkalithermobacter paradoxus]|uniref:Minor extracellular protease Epr n=1 Tax=Alkalithermobacter paradoxus TaxID=29349 RepID=A0A1V4I970_9FIRM|nr:minor extracellular protease Epr precursor [[Clostridium] thermoalcaliphilum]
MRKVVSIFVILIYIFSTNLYSHEYEPYDDRLLVVFKDEVDRSIIENLNGKIVSEFENIPMLSVIIPSSRTKYLMNNSAIEAIEYDNIVEIKGQVIDWGIERINANRAWNLGYTGKGVKIAIIDTGVDKNHEDIKILGGASFVDYTSSYNDDNGHGTHIAGIIGAKNNDFGVVGVAPDSEIYAVKALNSDGIGYISHIIAGIDWAITNKMDIINLSLGSNTHSLALKSAVDRAYDNGILVVAAAGNERVITYPAMYDSVIAVSAIDSLNNIASFSAIGREIEVSAPGVSILSTHLNNKYKKLSGTSMASGYVTGNIALLIEANRNSSHKEIRSLLTNNAIDLGLAGRDEMYGYGLVQFPYLVMNINKFMDIGGHWAKDDILWTSDKGLMIGTTNKTFSPNEPLTRAQAATIFVRALNLENSRVETSYFNDIGNHWAKNSIEIAYSNGLMVGMGEGIFSPNTLVTREQMAVILERILNHEKIEHKNITFKDIDKNRWSYTSIIRMANLGIFAGYQDGTFRPIEALTRAQMAALMRRIYRYIEN